MEAYVERMVEEFNQLTERVIKLHDMIEKWDNGELEFEPTCPRHVLHGQLCAMYAYRDWLIQRAEIEHIDL